MSLRTLANLLLVCLFTCLAGVSEASVITFTDRTAFQTSVGSPLAAETFDALVGRTFSTASGLTIGGVNFVGIFPPDFFLAVVDDSTFPPLPAAKSLSTVSHMRLTFSAPVSVVGFDLYVTSSVLFGVNATLGAAFSNGDAAAIQLPSRETFVGFRTSTPFLAVDLTTAGPSFLSIDSLYTQQTSVPVPEPASVVLVGVAIVAMGMRAGCRTQRARL